MITKKELTKLTKQIERLKQMGKDIFQVEYDGYNRQNKMRYKTFAGRKIL